MGWKVFLDSTLFAGVPTAVLVVLLKANEAPLAVEIGAPILFGSALLFVVEQASPRFHAFVLARRGPVVASIALFCVLLGIATDGALGGLRVAGLGLPIHGMTYVRLTLAGTLVGLVLRMSIGRLFYLGLTGRAVQSVKRVFFATVAALVILVPSPPHQPLSVSAYFIGLGTGFLFHFGMRTSLRRTARRANRTINLLRFLEPATTLPARTFSNFERYAIELHARADFNGLRAHLERTTIPYNSTLVIISAVMDRVTGDYARALNTILTHLDTPQVDPSLKSKLHCLVALCFGELGDDAKMWRALDEALRANRDCALSNLTVAIRKAEGIPLDAGVTGSTQSQEALRYIRRVLELVRTRRSLSFEEELVGGSVPITWSSVLDGYAYALLKAGELRLARTLFSTCIRDDPDFSAAYLHLGEWHLKRRASMRDDAARAEASKLAETCLRVAIHLERGRDSRTRRNAQRLLNATCRSGVGTSGWSGQNAADV